MRKGILLFTLLVILSLPAAMAGSTVKEDELYRYLDQWDKERDYFLERFVGTVFGDYESQQRVTTGGSQCSVGGNCQDTDYGLDIYKAGTVSGKVYMNGNSLPFEFTDYCKEEPYEDILVEYFCSEGLGCGDYPKLVFVECKNGCEQTRDGGQCITEEVPEFSGLALGGVTAAALAGIFLLRRRN